MDKREHKPSHSQVDHRPDTAAFTSEPEPSTQTVKTLLEATPAALRSYQYGNADPDLARRVADEIKLKTGWGY